MKFEYYVKKGLQAEKTSEERVPCLICGNTNYLVAYSSEGAGPLCGVLCISIFEEEQLNDLERGEGVFRL